MNSLVAEQHYGLPGKFTLTLSEFDDELRRWRECRDKHALIYRPPEV